MKRRIRRSAGVLLLFALWTAPARPADDAILRKDLTAVIMLLGMPCGRVVGAERRSDNDHVARCENGNRYRVYLNAEGRVIAQKQ